MPTINKNFQLQVSPEQFINACSDAELYETWLQMGSPGVQHRLAGLFGKENIPVRPMSRQNQFKSLLEQAKTNK